MAFQKGRTKTGGRKPGVPNKWNFPDIKVLCEEKNYDPLRELIDLLPSLDSEAQIRVHIAILPFTRPKKIEIDTTAGGLYGRSNPLRKLKTAEELIELLPVTNAQSKADSRSTPSR